MRKTTLQIIKEGDLFNNQHNSIKAIKFKWLLFTVVINLSIYFSEVHIIYNNHLSNYASLKTWLAIKNDILYVFVQQVYHLERNKVIPSPRKKIIVSTFSKKSFYLVCIHL